MTLRKYFGATALPLLVATTAVQANDNRNVDDEWSVKGVNRILLESGDAATNLWYPEFFVTAKNGNWTIQAAPDVVDKSANRLGGDIEVRAHTASVAYDFGDVELKGGVLPPFGRRMTGSEFDQGLMGAYLSDQLTIQGGVIGAQMTYESDITDQMSAHWHVMGGTKIEGVSEFGHPQGAGFDAPIWGAGVDVVRGDVKVGYNYTAFGAGPNGDAQDVHYMYAAAYQNVNDVRFGVFAEVKYSLTENNVSGDRGEDTHYVVMAQAIGGLSNGFGWRAGVGLADDVPAVEGYLTYKPDNWAMQLGVAAVEQDAGREFIGNMVLKRSF